jgi:hypothetical protein
MWKGPRRAAPDVVADKGRIRARCRDARDGTSLSVGRSFERPEDIQGVFSISNNAVPIINKYLFIDVDPLAQKSQIVRIEAASY